VCVTRPAGPRPGSGASDQGPLAPGSGIAAARTRVVDRAGDGPRATPASASVPRPLDAATLRADVDGSADLGALLAGLEPALRPDGYVFCALTDRVIPADLAPLLIFQEDEGTTLVLRGSDARRIGMPDSTAWAWISLEVRSSLEAVGLLAAVSAELAAHGISCNVVSAYHHDHLFVPLNRGEEAVVILRELSRRARSARR